MKSTLYFSLTVLFCLLLQSCGVNNFSRQKYTNFGHTKGLRFLSNSERTTLVEEDSPELIKVSDDEVVVQNDDNVSRDQFQDEEPTVKLENEENETETIVYSESRDTLNGPEIEKVDLNELHREFNAISIGGIVSTLVTAGSTVLVILMIESVGSILILFIPVAFAILAFVLMIMAVRRGRELNRIYKAVGSSPNWSFYVLYGFDILFLFATAGAILYALILILIIIAIVTGGGFY